MKKTVSIFLVSVLIITAGPFLPLFSGHGKLLFIRDGTNGITAAVQTSRQIGVPFAFPAKICYYAASAMYGSAKPGCYSFGRTSLFRAMKDLCGGNLSKIIVPEGATAAETAAIISSALGLKSDNQAMQTIINNPPAFEGNFFPATYPLTSDDPEKILQAMTAKSRSVAKKFNFTKEDFIIASVVQKETRYPVQMRRCAGVLKNRLNTGIKLECDSVLQYIAGKCRLTKEILAKDSPYNVFLRNGLPPSPICNPGIEALQAAHSPERHDYFYFVARRDGRLYFSKNKHEHFKAVEFFVLGRPNGFKPEQQ